MKRNTAANFGQSGKISVSLQGLNSAGRAFGPSWRVLRGLLLIQLWQAWPAALAGINGRQKLLDGTGFGEVVIGPEFHARRKSAMVTFAVKKISGMAAVSLDFRRVDSTE
jgi:hypothetical protein